MFTQKILSRAALSTLAFVSLAGALSGCTAKGELGEPEHELSSYGAFPASSATSADADAPLVAQVTQPSTEQLLSNVISVSFNKPMVEASLREQKSDTPLFEIDPPVPGTFSWVGTRMAVFHPAEPFAPSTYYTVRVPAGVESADATLLKSEANFKFHTPFLSVWARTNTEKLKPGSVLKVHFNLPVELSDLQKHLELRRDSEPLETNITALDAHQSAVSGGASFIVEPVEGFKLHATYTLNVDGALRARSGTESLAFGITNKKVSLGNAQKKRYQQRYSERGYQAVFEAYGDFTITNIDCGYSDQCWRSSSWKVTFSNPIDPKSADKCIRFASAKTNKGLDHYTYQSRVHVSPQNVTQGATETLIVSRDCVDVFGNRLDKGQRYSRKVNYNRPNLQMSSGGVRVIENAREQQVPSIPLRLENMAQPTRIKVAEIPPARLPLLYANFWDLDSSSLPDGLGEPKTHTLGKSQKLGKAEIHDIDLSQTLKKPHGAVYIQTIAPDLASEHHDGTNKSILIFTDLGITLKKDAQSALIWVTRLSTGEPVADAEVALWHTDGAKKWRGKTDKNGLVTAALVGDDAAGISVISAAAGDDMTVLELDDWSASVSMYGFDVYYYPGMASVAAKTFIFTERGVYKAGDTVHIKGYTRLQNRGRLEEMPAKELTLDIRDPRGQNIALETVELSPLGGYSLDLKLPADARLGSYQIKATPVLSDAAKAGTPGLDDLESDDTGSFRVEAYRTPEFEVLVEPKKPAVLDGANTSVAIRGRYLFGAPMRGATTNWNVRREHSWFYAADFPAFSFRPDTKNYWYYDASESRTLSDDSGVLSDDGRLDVEIAIPKDKDFQGPQRVQIEASITDINRQELSGRASIKVHPGQYYVGVSQPEYLVRDDEVIQPKAIATDHQGRPVAGKKITLRVLRREWKTERKKNTSGDYSWVSSTEDTPVDSCILTSKSTPVGCDFKLAGTGSYRVLAESTDALGNKLQSADSFYVYGGGSFAWDRNDTERIELVANAKKYKVGEVATLMIQSPFEQANALITVEKNSIIQQFTTELKGNSPTVEIPITDAMKPNAFVSVSLIRGRTDAKPSANPRPGQNRNDPGRPSFKIGYTEIKVDHSDKVLAVSVTPDKKTYRPGARVRAKVELRDHHGAPSSGEVTFMAVDQGVLSLTGYQTPSPGEYFFASVPLGVRNSDTRLMLDTHADLAAQRAGMKSDSGGGGGGGVATNYRSDFAAAATFKALVTVDASGEATVDFDLPDSLTSYRLMAVAVGPKNRFGSADTRITVNKPLMVRPALPRFASTGDAFEARAVIQAMAEFKGKVEVQVSIDGALILGKETKKTITLKAGGNQEVGFPVSAGLPGEAKIRFVATAVDAPATTDAVEVTLPVKYPAAEDTYLQTGTLALDQTWAKPTMRRRIELPDTIRKDVGGLEITLSSSPFAELLPGLDYLVQYPYGCTEQVTSQVLGLISMRDVAKGLDIPGLTADAIDKRVDQGLKKVMKRQTRKGGIAYWSGQSHAHAWSSVYAALSAVRAREASAHQVDGRQYVELIDYLRGILRQQTPLPKDGMRSALATKAFAAWVLAEAGVPEPAYHVELYQKRDNMPRSAQLFLAMAMHSANATPKYRTQLLDDVLAFAEVDLGGDGGAATLQGVDYRDPYSWQIWQSATRANAVALIALMRMRPDDALVPKFAQGLLRERSNGHWQNTQNTAFALMALGEYFGRAQQQNPDYEVLVGTGQTVVAREHFDKLEIRPRKVFIPMKDLAKFEGQLLTIKQVGSGGPLYYSAKLTSTPTEPPTRAFDGGLHLHREYFATDGPDAGKAIASVRPGQVVKVRLTLTVPEERHYIAVEDPLPAGFEAINTSFETTSRALEERELAGENGTYAGWWWSYWPMNFDFSEQLDDRVTLFKSRLTPGIYRHAYLARATTPGKFTAPAAKVEAMYDPTIYGLSDARKVDID